MEKEVHLGVTGPFGAGKTAAINALEEVGFTYHSLSDEVRKEARAQGHTELERDILINVGNNTRREYGQMVFAQRVLDSAKDDDKAIFDGIRAVGEVNYFKENDPNFILIAITASEETRYNRILSRGRAGDPKTLDEIAIKDRKDRGIGIDECVKMAHHVIVNEGITIEQLTGKLFEYIGIERQKVCEVANIM
ncbi:AAA family ATPase [Candidatus Woesearchaeota archaeon]|jgi:dephospho-CoA kinase|nr:AAA family ATPase [Candidatus Woesearchaeota archaeon]MBT7062457.1 AAA family ATPase [Candidatus Woesearchaeota archaeon]MBT7402890.1 AAA family ATPase [Candidatus Woesearchaeota archaeon]